VSSRLREHSIDLIEKTYILGHGSNRLLITRLNVWKAGAHTPKIRRSGLNQGAFRRGAILRRTGKSGVAASPRGVVGYANNPTKTTA
jgi:hypothetical protein